MEFGLNESQEILKESARRFFEGECPIAEVRRLSDTETAFDGDLWAKLADQGYTGIIFPEEFDGVGLGIVELALLMEEAGRALLPGPLFSTVALAGSVFHALGTSEQKKKYLGAICRGEARATVAWLESNVSWEPEDARMSCVNSRLNGGKLFVMDAEAATWIVVVAKNGVFAVDPRSPGVTVIPMDGMDLTRKIYAVQLEDCAAEKLGETSQIGRPLDVATVALCAELVGGMQRSLDLTVEYAKTRKQFGKPIGMFQAVQHQCADTYMETESARSAVYYAAWTLEHNMPDAASAVSIAKIYASEASRTVGNRGIQVHGGMGFTWENDLHLYYRRAKASETAFGDPSYHRERLAKLVIDSCVAATQTA